MQHQINIITIGVSDVETMAHWYEENFGWAPIRKEDGTIFFRLDNLLLILTQEDKLAKDMCVWQDGYGFKRCVLTIGFNSEKELDMTFHQLHKKGVTIIKGPEKNTSGIYRACVSDPEENFWELAFYPFTEIDQSSVPELLFQS